MSRSRLETELKYDANIYQSVRYFSRYGEPQNTLIYDLDKVFKKIGAKARIFDYINDLINIVIKFFLFRL